ncbi:MAG: tRNA (adenosine(37)-N6)-threonylcarbamoyltransferase complex dimerization subunit type 1 TsaB [Bacilli bacterium]
MYKLFVSTVSDEIFIAIIKDEEIHEYYDKSVSNHAQKFLPLIDKALKENNIKLKDISEVIAVNGPGSFTGIRIGLSFVKTLSYSLNIPVKVISSLMSYLVSSDFKGNKISKIFDNKGCYICAVDQNNKVIIDEEYKSTDDLKLYDDFCLVDQQFNVKRILKYLEDIPFTNVFNVKPSYIKKIDTEKAINKSKNELEYKYSYVEKEIVIGYVIFRINFDVIDITDVFVNEDKRRKHIASILLNEIFCDYKGKNSYYLEVREDNIGAINLYKSFNFNIINKRKNYYNDCDALIMSKEMEVK